MGLKGSLMLEEEEEVLSEHSNMDERIHWPKLTQVGGNFTITITIITCITIITNTTSGSCSSIGLQRLKAQVCREHLELLTLTTRCEASR